jgi:uncharacterized protein (UPF0335 family)
MNNVNGIAADRLRSFVERVERLEEEKAALMADIKDVFAEAKGAGFDVKTMRKIIALRKMDAADREESEALLDLYKSVMGLDGTPLGNAAKKFVDAVAKEDGDSVTVTGPGGKGFSIKNEGGEKTVTTH